MKTLKTIQTLSKIGKVLSNIAFIVSIVAACLCIAGTLCLNLGAEKILDNIAFDELIDISSEDTLAVANAALVGGILICIGEAVLAKFAAVYFKHELSAGTPFTHKGAGELKRLGILAIVIPVVCSAAAYFVAEFVFGFMDKITSNIVNNPGLL